ncbi:MAG: hypothetical protein NBV68_16750 [Erythrobacter sp.]|uniref:hypothetical protein n=1 Tax=Erythrobacter sp. TaxID=1042 RepID=UPI0025D20252|nr:hypothetical protein [Erythrobacter sp.]MCM0001025.1 hypothetical protein [Erythrobacter sp.]
MSIFFAMIGQGEARRPAFFLTRSAAPEGAVKITAARHAALLEDQAEGRTIIADARGRPVIDRRTQPSAETIRAQLIAAIRREAARRIHAVSPEWRQLNDLREPSEAGAVRFARIDAIRAASNAIEEFAGRMPPADLAGFPFATHTLWPEFD